MDLSSSKILNSVTCDVQLAKLIHIASDSSCVRQIHAIIASGGRTEPSGADTEYCSNGQAWRLSHPCLWSGREWQQGHWDPRQDTQDIFKTGEDPGASRGTGCFRDNLMITTSLWGRCHYHGHLYHHINCHHPTLAPNELRVRGVADHIHRTQKHLFLILMTGILSSEVLNSAYNRITRAVGGGGWLKIAGPTPRVSDSTGLEWEVRI